MKVALAADHAGYRYKQEIKRHLQSRGIEVMDCGTDSESSVDYPPLMAAAARAVADGGCDRGIVLGGSGNGEAMAANRFRGVRCALCWSLESARLARQHNDANMISFGQRLLPLDLVLAMVDAWLDTPFEGGRHVRRIEMLDRLE